MVITVCDLALQNTDVLIVSAYLSPTEVGMYFAAAKTMSLIMFIHYAVGSAVANHFAALKARGDHESLKALVRDAVNWTFWPSLAAAIVILALGKPLLWLFSPQFTEAYPVMFVLAIGFLVRASMGPAEFILNMLGEQQLCALVLVVSAVLDVALSFALVPVFGMIGAAIATSVALVDRRDHELRRRPPPARARDLHLEQLARPVATRSSRAAAGGPGRIGRGNPSPTGQAGAPPHANGCQSRYSGCAPVAERRPGSGISHKLKSSPRAQRVLVFPPTRGRSLADHRSQKDCPRSRGFSASLRRLMPLQEGARPVDGPGLQFRRILPGIDRDLGIRRQRRDIDRGLKRVRRDVVRQHQHRRLAGLRTKSRDTLYTKSGRTR